MSIIDTIRSLAKPPEKKRPKLSAVQVELTEAERTTIRALQEGNCEIIFSLSFADFLKIFQYYESKKKFELVKDHLPPSLGTASAEISLSNQILDPKLFMRKQIYMIGMTMYYKVFPMPEAFIRALFSKASKQASDLPGALQIRQTQNSEHERKLADRFVFQNNRNAELWASVNKGSKKLISAMHDEKRQVRSVQRQSHDLNEQKVIKKLIISSLKLVLDNLEGQKILDVNGSNLFKKIVMLDPGQIPKELHSELVSDSNAYGLLRDLSVVRMGRHGERIKLYVNDFSG